MTSPGNQAGWARLFRIACSLIRQVNTERVIIDSWSFGGGTAMMLQIDHRESRDIDIFLPDAQQLRFLDPEIQDFSLEIRPTECWGDGVRFLKLAFEGIGEIDFIVDHPLTLAPTALTTIENEAVQLETIPEIITKKIVHRGPRIKARDIFDIAAAGRTHAAEVIAALGPYKREVIESLSAIERLNPDFISRAIAALAIRPHFRAIAETSPARAREILLAV